MDIQQRQLIKKYVDLVIDRWRLISLCLLLSITAGLGYYLLLPKSYQSTSLLRYEEQEINKSRDNIRGKNEMQEALATLQELVTSRGNLEKVIQQFDLYKNLRRELPIEDVIVRMRNRITVQPSSKESDVFSVSFEGSSPEKVMKVTNSLASLFIEENLRYREEKATDASVFTEAEQSKAQKIVDAKEQQMRDYKLKYFNEMPEQRESNLARLQAMTEQNQGLQDSIQDLERTKVMAREQIAMYKRLAISGATESSVSNSREPLSNTEKLYQLEQHLASLQGKYTEKHPEIKHTKQQIKQLKAQIARGGGGGRRSSNSVAGSVAQQEEIERLELQLKEIDVNIAQLRAQQAQLPAEMAKYRSWIEAAPVREAEWNQLTRDYTELRRHYDELVAKSLAAKSRENLERNQKGDKFRVIDSALLPEKPFKPNFKKAMALAIGLGLGLSLGCILLIDFMDTSFKDVGEIEDYTGVPVICAVPFIEKNAETKKKKVLFVLSVVVISVYAVILFGAIIYLWLQGKIIV